MPKISQTPSSGISFWLWGKIVQEKLDELKEQSQNHRIRKQKGILLPSGARRIDLYTKSENYGFRVKDRIISVDQRSINELLYEYDRPDLLMFGKPKTVEVCLEIYMGIGSPILSARIGWEVFAKMVNYYFDTPALHSIDAFGN